MKVLLFPLYLLSGVAQNLGGVAGKAAAIAAGLALLVAVVCAGGPVIGF